MESLKARIWTDADTSSGDAGRSVEVDTGLFSDAFEKAEDREFIRGELKGCFGQMWDDGGVKVIFSDENR